jgi:hypothetical protein
MTKTQTQIVKWIKEAEKSKSNVYAYIALEKFGYLDLHIKEMAKQWVFMHLYGGSEKASKEPPQSPMDDAMDDAMKRLEETPLVWPPRIAFKTLPVYQRYVVKVKASVYTPERHYSVPAQCPQDARLLAFALHGGFGSFDGATPILVDSDIKLALDGTEIVE